MKNQRCCYVDTIGNFLKTEHDTWLETMRSTFVSNHTLPLEAAQLKAWRDCFKVLQNQLGPIGRARPNFYVVFEYDLPYESGRRPDVVLVSKEQVIILEFKQYGFVKRADIDQVAAYGRDIREYHFESRNHQIKNILVLTGAEVIEGFDDANNVFICGRNNLGNILSQISSQKTTKENIEQWLSSKYEPLPTIVEAAKMFVKHEALPNIRRVNSTCIPQAIECLKEVSEYAKKNSKHVVAFVTGVPGAGKTFLGLKYVYDICEDFENVNSVYLSGNGPLVAVLTNALHSSVFVKDLHKVVTQYLKDGALDFRNNIVVFDEGQRAWDSDQMAAKRNTIKSEPDVIVELCSKRLEWCVLLVLVGEGQEIHNGENAGLIQWNTAINKAEKKWEIICPDKILEIFPGQKIIDKADRNALNLSISLRTHLAGDVSKFANAFIAGDILSAKKYSNEIKKQGFSMYVTRNLNVAKEYLKQRYTGELTKRYGMIASSKGKLLRRHEMDNTFMGALSSYSVGKWFNAAIDDPKSCCALDMVATEFSCQGLEIDMPLIGWDDDMVWDGKEWKKYKPFQPEDSDMNVYRKNSYRVLLTRGRDGFVIFVPPEEEMDKVYDVIVEAGVEKLYKNYSIENVDGKVAEEVDKGKF